MLQTGQSKPVNHLDDLTCIIDKTSECLKSISEEKTGIIVHKNDRYATIDTTALVDSKLSYKAVGLHYYMQTQMIQHTIGKRDLINSHVDGRVSVTSGMQELIRGKYLYKVRLTTSTGAFAGTVYVSCAVPTLLDETKLKKGLNEKYRALAEPPEPQESGCDIYNQLWDKIKERTMKNGNPSKPENDLQNEPVVKKYKIYKKAKKYNKNKPLSHIVHDEPIPQVPKITDFAEKTEQNQTAIRKPNNGKQNTSLTKYRDQVEPLPSNVFTNNFPLTDFVNTKPLKKKLSGQSKIDCQTTDLKTAFDRKILKTVFETWNKQTKLPTHRIDPRTKLFYNTRILVHKCLLGKGYGNKHTLSEILEAIKNYGWITTQPFNMLENKNRPIVVRLDEFFEFSDFSKGKIADEKHLLHGVQSWFKECRKGQSYLLDKYSARKKDKHPKLTTLLAELLLESKVFGFSDEKKLTPLDTNTLIGVSETLRNFVTTNSARLAHRDIYVKTIQGMIHLLEEDKRRKSIHVGFMRGDIFWRRLEQLLLERGIMRSR